MATPWEQEVARRKALIEQIYQQELGRGQVDAGGMNYWLQQAQDLNNDEKLRSAIRWQAEKSGLKRAEAPVVTADQPTPLTEAAGPNPVAFSGSEDPAWAAEKARRQALIEQIYYQELGRSDVDAEGLQHWMAVAGDLNNDDKLRQAIRSTAGVQGPAVNPDLSQDPTMAAFLRQMQFDESQIQTTLERARTAASNNITSQSPIFDLQRTQSARNVSSEAEARGMFRSGRRIERQAEARDSIDLNQRRFEEGQRDSMLGAEQDAADSIANLRRQKAEQELAARNRLTQQSVV